MWGFHNPQNLDTRIWQKGPLPGRTNLATKIPGLRSRWYHTGWEAATESIHFLRMLQEVSLVWRFQRRHHCHEEAFLIAVSSSGHWAEEGQETAVRPVGGTLITDGHWSKGEKTDVKICENPKQGLCSQGQEASDCLVYHQNKVWQCITAAGLMSGRTHPSSAPIFTDLKTCFIKTKVARKSFWTC